MPFWDIPINRFPDFLVKPEVNELAVGAVPCGPSEVLSDAVMFRFWIPSPVESFPKNGFDKCAGSVVIVDNLHSVCTSLSGQ